MQCGSARKFVDTTKISRPRRQMNRSNRAEARHERVAQSDQMRRLYRFVAPKYYAVKCDRNLMPEPLRHDSISRLVLIISIPMLISWVHVGRLSHNGSLTHNNISVRSGLAIKICLLGKIIILTISSRDSCFELLIRTCVTLQSSLNINLYKARCKKILRHNFKRKLRALNFFIYLSRHILGSISLVTEYVSSLQRKIWEILRHNFERKLLSALDFFHLFIYLLQRILAPMSLNKLITECVSLVTIKKIFIWK